MRWKIVFNTAGALVVVVVQNISHPIQSNPTCITGPVNLTVLNNEFNAPDQTRPDHTRPDQTRPDQMWKGAKTNLVVEPMDQEDRQTGEENNHPQNLHREIFSETFPLDSV